MIKKLPVYLIGCAVFLYGCSFYHIESEDLPNNIYAAKASVQEVRYMENVKGTPHEVIGYVIIQTERAQSFDNLSLRLRHEAARIGGDAISNLETDATGFWKKLPAQRLIGNAYVRAKFRATVLKLK